MNSYVSHGLRDRDSETVGETERGRERLSYTLLDPYGGYLYEFVCVG